MSIVSKISGTLSALGYNAAELAEILQINTRRAKALLSGTAKSISFQEYCRICKMLGVDANFFYLKEARP